jgi:hypothetical protein
MARRPHIPTRLKVVGMLLIAVAMVLAIWRWAPRATSPTADDGVSEQLFGASIELDIGKKKMRLLEEQRSAALAIGILQPDAEEWVKAKLLEGHATWQVRVRLKGDWTDHLEGHKWSFSVELRDSLRPVWRRMRSFSLQSPERRSYLDEWLLHQVLAGEGLLTTTYDFLRLRLNGRSLGVYAVEEHFGKEMLERQHRREGPIVRIDEAGMWDARVEALRDSAFPYLQTPFFESAPVRPYEKGRLLTDTVFRAQFEQAQRLMAQYRLGLANPDEVFDLERSARHYALTDLFGAYHGLIWHNRRYYLDPFTLRLEPVAYDGYAGPEGGMDIRHPFWGYALHGRLRDDADYRDQTSVFVFEDPAFVRAYYHHLARYSDPHFLDSTLAALAPQLREREALLQAEWQGYGFDPLPIRQNARLIQTILRHGLRQEHVAARCLPLPADSCLVIVQNHNALPIEVWVDGDSLRPAQFLEADCGQGGQAHARFRLHATQRLCYRLPGTSGMHKLPFHVTE